MSTIDIPYIAHRNCQNYVYEKRKKGECQNTMLEIKHFIMKPEYKANKNKVLSFCEELRYIYI